MVLILEKISLDKLELYILRKIAIIISFMDGLGYKLFSIKVYEKNRIHIYLDKLENKLFNRRIILIGWINKDTKENKLYSHTYKDWRGNIVNVYKEKHFLRF